MRAKLFVRQLLANSDFGQDAFLHLNYSILFTQGGGIAKTTPRSLLKIKLKFSVAPMAMLSMHMASVLTSVKLA